jgi:organic hydroperoxide reductase OsmC/OhrA
VNATTKAAGQTPPLRSPVDVRNPDRGMKKSQTRGNAQHFRVVAWWVSGSTGIAKSNSAPNAIHFTSPPAFGGLEGRWTSKDLLLASVASCYTTTFRALAEYSRFEYTDLQVEVEGFIGDEAKGNLFDKVVVVVNLAITQEAEEAKGQKLIHDAKRLCLVMRAFAAKRSFTAVVTVGKLAPTK